MGMAASQARFLGLTARMNNIEFEGQQINQQRTALSNKSASYYSDLLGMKVPTPPSVEQFTQTVYSFDDGALTNQITSLIAANDGTYKVSYIRSWTDDFSAVAAVPSLITRVANDDDGYDYKIGAETLRNLADFSGIFKNAEDEEEDLFLNPADGKFYTDEEFENEFEGTVTINIGPDSAFNTDFYKSLSVDQFIGLAEEEAAYKALLNETKSLDNADWLVRYKQNTTSGEFEATFYEKGVVENAIYSDETNNTLSFVEALKIGSKDRTEEIKGIDGCEIEQDSTGRYINITIPTGTGTSKTYALATSTVTDQDAYNDAMNQYEYDKALYDQTIDEINAKIEIVQAEDKNLELRLKQLDTEHNAISNEKDAVSKVIEKNVESTFKTFG